MVIAVVTRDAADRIVARRRAGDAHMPYPPEYRIVPYQATR